MAGFYVGKFITPIDARNALIYAREIAEEYAYVTMADIHDLIADKSEYTDCKYGWTLSKLKLAYIETLAPDMYSIRMPAFDWFSDKKDATTVTKFPTTKSKQTEPEPINITIPADKADKLEQTISVLLKDPEKVKDRPVFITII